MTIQKASCTPERSRHRDSSFPIARKKEEAMRTYFFGDIHGNLHALDECLKHMDAVEVDEAYCLGDLAGWLPFGDRTVARMRSLGIPAVAGNHDLLIAGAFTDDPAQIDRMQATAYNAGLLSSIPGAIDYLETLPLIIEKNDWTMTHHSPFHLPGPGEPPHIENFRYLDNAALAGRLKEWRAHPLRLIFTGHDHIPAIYQLPDSSGSSPRLEDVLVHRPSWNEPLTIAIDPASRYWIKAGCVGGPYRDGVPCINSVLYDSSRGTLTLFRIRYSTDRLHEELASHVFFRNIPAIRKYIRLLQSQGISSNETAHGNPR